PTGSASSTGDFGAQYRACVFNCQRLTWPLPASVHDSVPRRVASPLRVEELPLRCSAGLCRRTGCPGYPSRVIPSMYERRHWAAIGEVRGEDAALSQTVAVPVLRLVRLPDRLSRRLMACAFLRGRQSLAHDLDRPAPAQSTSTHA